MRKKAMTLQSVTIGALALTLTLGGLACERGGHEVAEEVDETVDDVKEGVDEAVEDVSDKVDEVVEDAEH